MELIQKIIILIYVLVSYHSISLLQERIGIFYFGTVKHYLIGKVLLALVLGWLAIILCLINGLYTTNANS